MLDSILLLLIIFLASMKFPMHAAAGEKEKSLLPTGYFPGDDCISNLSKALRKHLDLERANERT